jgi:hypothetical protein
MPISISPQACRNRAAAGEFCLRLQLIGDAELANDLGRVRAAAAARVADRRPPAAQQPEASGVDVGFAPVFAMPAALR